MKSKHSQKRRYNDKMRKVAACPNGPIKTYTRTRTGDKVSRKTNTEMKQKKQVQPCSNIQRHISPGKRKEYVGRGKKRRVKYLRH